MLGVTLAGAQESATNLPAPLNWSAGQDHQNMMDQLGIKSLRPGAEGMNRQAPNYQNTDESKANPYPNLPDPLTLKNGEKVTTPELWWQRRRPEIVEDFDREVYGRVPANVPKVTWKVVSTVRTNNGDLHVITKRLVGQVDNSAYPLIDVNIELTLTTPADAAGPVPVMLEFGFGNFAGFGRGRPGNTNTVSGTNAPRALAGFTGPNWQQLVLSNGWGCAVIVPTSYQADNGAGLTKGIIGLCNHGQARKPEDWGALRAWAWGASRALDYFGTDPAVDAKQVGIEGLSRYGKATIVTMAYDQRFAIALVGSSGPTRLATILQVDPAFKAADYESGMVQLLASGLNVILVDCDRCAAKIGRQSIEEDDHQTDWAGTGDGGVTICDFCRHQSHLLTA